MDRHECSLHGLSRRTSPNHLASGRVVALPGTLEQAIPRLEKRGVVKRGRSLFGGLQGQANVVFIDADDPYEAVSSDIARGRPPLPADLAGGPEDTRILIASVDHADHLAVTLPVCPDGITGGTNPFGLGGYPAARAATSGASGSGVAGANGALGSTAGGYA